MDNLYGSRSEYTIKEPESRTLVRDLIREADSIAIKEFAPPGVIVNDNYEIIQFRGNTSKYLINPHGAPSLNIVKMMNSLNGIKIQSAQRETAETGMKKIVRGLRRESRGELKAFDAEVTPLKARRENEQYFLVVFNEKESDQPSASSYTEPQSSDLNQLQDELNETKAYLQNYMEESESYNEELISSHEELQSVNEELEPTKEELQASNEELSTMNEELQSRVMELDQLYNDLNNLVNSIDIPIVIIDSNLKIRRVTPKVGELLNIRAIDVGRSIEEINLNIEIPEFKEILLDTIEGLSTHKMELQDRKGRWYSFSVKPYRTANRRVDGAVLVFIDIDDIKKGRIDTQRLETISGKSEDVVIILDAEDRILGWNKSADTMYNISADEIIGKNMAEVFPREESSKLWDLYESAKYGESFRLVEINGLDKKGEQRDLLVSIYPIEAESGLINEIVIIERSVTKLRELEKEVARLEKENGDNK